MTDIVKRENNSIIANNAGAPMGFEDFDNDIVIVPRAKVMQGLSPELQDEDCNFRMGDLIHSLLLEKLPDKFVPIRFWQSRTMFVPRSDKKEFFEKIGVEEVDTMFVCRSLDGRIPQNAPFNWSNCSDCIYKDFGWDGNTDTPPLCTHNINCLALFEGHELPVVLQFSNTNFKYGRRFASMARYSGGAAFTKKYKITPKREQNEKGVFFTTPVKPAGKPTDEEFVLAKAMYEQFSGVTVEVEEDNSVMEEAATVDVEY